MLLAIISDIHANLPALEAVLADIDTSSVDELWSLAHFVGVTGFMFGFMRPVVLGHDRRAAREMAGALADIIGRAV